MFSKRERSATCRWRLECPGGHPLRVFLLNVFAKGEKINLSKAERNELKRVLADIADVYRKGVTRYVKGR